MTTSTEGMIDSGLRCNLDGAIGGTYQLPDGREFWMDAAATREIVARIEPVIASWLEAHSPSPMPSDAVEEWSLSFHGSPPSAFVKAGLPGLPDTRRDVAYFEYASRIQRTEHGAALRALVDAHNAALQPSSNRRR